MSSYHYLVNIANVIITSLNFFRTVLNWGIFLGQIGLSSKKKKKKYILFHHNMVLPFFFKTPKTVLVELVKTFGTEILTAGREQPSDLQLFC